MSRGKTISYAALFLAVGLGVAFSAGRVQVGPTAGDPPTPTPTYSTSTRFGLPLAWRELVVEWECGGIDCVGRAYFVFHWTFLLVDVLFFAAASCIIFLIFWKLTARLRVRPSPLARTPSVLVLRVRVLGVFPGSSFGIVRILGRNGLG